MQVRMSQRLHLVMAAVLLTGCAGALPSAPAEHHLTALAAELGKQGDTTSAVALYERAAMAMPEDPQVLIALGHAHLRNHDPAAATVAFQQAYRLQEGSPEALLGLGQAALMQDRPGRGRELIGQAASQMPTARTYTLLGISHVRGQDMDAAIAAFQKARQLEPDSLEHQANEALAYALAGQAAMAIQTIAAVTASPLAQAHHTRRAVLIVTLAGDDPRARELSLELPASERASLLARARDLRDLDSVADRAAAMGMASVTAMLAAP